MPQRSPTMRTPTSAAPMPRMGSRCGRTKPDAGTAIVKHLMGEVRQVKRQMVAARPADAADANARTAWRRPIIRVRHLARGLIYTRLLNRRHASNDPRCCLRISSSETRRLRKLRPSGGETGAVLSSSMSVYGLGSQRYQHHGGVEVFRIMNELLSSLSGNRAS